VVDLHTHSTASDGSYSPEELVRLAKESGLFALALTDHDTVDGLPSAVKTAKEVGINFVCGVEISVKFEGKGHFHLLGYFKSPEVPELADVLKKLHEARAKRNEKMLEKLNELGIDISMEELKEIAKGEIGRPHIAKLLVKKGVVKSFEEAFDKYLKKGAPAYVPKALLSPEEAISLVLKAGGIPVLAHPITLKLDYYSLKNYIKELKEMGLKGVEAYYTEHTEEFTQEVLKYAKEFDLIVTGGSDFHGENKPDIKLGRGFGNLRVPDECYYNLVEALESVSNKKSTT